MRERSRSAHPVDEYVGGMQGRDESACRVFHSSSAAGLVFVRPGRFRCGSLHYPFTSGRYLTAMTDIALSRTYRTRWSIAGGYVLCWIIGLLIGGPSLAPDAKAEEVQLAFAGSTSILAFAGLVHGVAAVLLASLGWALLSERAMRGIFPLSCAAAGLSLVQLVGEVILVSAPNALNAATVWEVISRVDGIKMLVLAWLVTAFHGGRSGRLSRPWRRECPNSVHLSPQIHAIGMVVRARVSTIGRRYSRENK